MEARKKSSWFVFKYSPAMIENAAFLVCFCCRTPQNPPGLHGPDSWHYYCGSRKQTETGCPHIRWSCTNSDLAESQQGNPVSKMSHDSSAWPFLFSCLILFQNSNLALKNLKDFYLKSVNFHIFHKMKTPPRSHISLIVSSEMSSQYFKCVGDSSFKNSELSLCTACLHLISLAKRMFGIMLLSLLFHIKQYRSVLSVYLCPDFWGPRGKGIWVSTCPICGAQIGFIL